MSRLNAPLSVVALALWAAAPILAQQPLYVRHHTPLSGRVSPFADAGMTQPLTMAQQYAVAPVKYPAVWPAPNVPPGTVLMVPLRPKGLPGPGEYWGPFSNDLGGWGFMVGPLPAPPPPPQPQFPDLYLYRQRGAFTQPVADPPPPPAPVLPIAGSISPEGRMVVTYPDGNQVTWQFPMVQYVATFNGIGPGGGYRLIERATGRNRTLGISRNVRFTMNGQPVNPRKVPVGTPLTAWALRMAPYSLTVLEFGR